MSRDTNKSKNMRRSALSFNGGDDTIDDFIDGIVQSESWKDTDEIEYSDIGRIQNVLNQFDEKITQEKILKSGENYNEISYKMSQNLSFIIILL